MGRKFGFVVQTAGWLVGAAVSAGSLVWARAFRDALKRKS